MAQDDGQERQVMPVMEEELVVTRRTVPTGNVRVRKVVREYEEGVDAPVIEAKVEVKRVPINEFVTEKRATRTEGETTIIGVYEEVTVVEKRLRLKEEIHIIRSEEVHRNPQTVTLRKEEVIVEEDEAEEE